MVHTSVASFRAFAQSRYDDSYFICAYAALANGASGSVRHGRAPTVMAS